MKKFVARIDHLPLFVMASDGKSKVKICLYKVADDATSKDVFDSFGVSFDELAMTNDQIEEFSHNHWDEYQNMCTYPIFLTKIGINFQVYFGFGKLEDVEDDSAGWSKGQLIVVCDFVRNYLKKPGARLV